MCNLQFRDFHRDVSRKKRDSSSSKAWDIVQKQGFHWPHKKAWCPREIFFKRGESVSYSSQILQQLSYKWRKLRANPELILAVKYTKMKCSVCANPDMPRPNSNLPVESLSYWSCHCVNPWGLMKAFKAARCSCRFWCQAFYHSFSSCAPKYSTHQKENSIVASHKEKLPSFKKRIL